MKAIWDAKDDISTPEIIETVRTKYKRDYARTTVGTFIQRLMEKGYVTSYHKGRISYLHAERAEHDYKDKFLKETTDFWFHGDVSNLISALCGTKKLSKKEINKIREIIDELDD